MRFVGGPPSCTANSSLSCGGRLFRDDRRGFLRGMGELKNGSETQQTTDKKAMCNAFLGLHQRSGGPSLGSADTASRRCKTPWPPAQQGAEKHSGWREGRRGDESGTCELTRQCVHDSLHRERRCWSLILLSFEQLCWKNTTTTKSGGKVTCCLSASWKCKRFDEPHELLLHGCAVPGH